tara:strand:- start:558 stop:1085 length:528 start_codon:yes stop_codon:yes gene_type:complete
MSTLELKELSHPAGEVIKIAAGKTLDLKSQGSVTMPTGSVLQVVQGTYATLTTLATSSYTDLGLSATITPSTTSSQILVMWTTQGKLASGLSNGWGCKLMRNTTAVYTDSVSHRTYGASTTGDIRLTTPVSYLDSPSTTSPITYKIQVSTYSGASMNFNDSGSETQITLMEIQGP